MALDRFGTVWQTDIAPNGRGADRPNGLPPPISGDIHPYEVSVMIRAYSFYSRLPDHPGHYDEVYIENRRVYNVQDAPNSKLAVPLPRDWAAGWLRIRRAYKNGDYSVFPEGSSHFQRRTSPDLFVPNKPIGWYDQAGRIVLHEDPENSNSKYGRRSGITVGGAKWVEERLDASNWDDFHMAERDECNEHGPVLCTVCGHEALASCPAECTCEEFKLPDCDECQQVYACGNGNCDCITRLEQCAECGADLGDGDDYYLCLDGGEVVCDKHVVWDDRPDSLFKKVGGLRGAALPAFAWPGGYTIVYATKGGSTICAECADETDTSDPAVDGWAEEEMNCEACEHVQSQHHDDTEPDGTERTACEECDCPKYLPPTCDDCSMPIDPAVRAAFKTAVYPDRA